MEQRAMLNPEKDIHSIMKELDLQIDVDVAYLASLSPPIKIFPTPDTEDMPIYEQLMLLEEEYLSHYTYRGDIGLNENMVRELYKSDEDEAEDEMETSDETEDEEKMFLARVNRDKSMFLHKRLKDDAIILGSILKSMIKRMVQMETFAENMLIESGETEMPDWDEVFEDPMLMEYEAKRALKLKNASTDFSTYSLINSINLFSSSLSSSGSSTDSSSSRSLSDSPTNSLFSSSSSCGSSTKLFFPSSRAYSTSSISSGSSTNSFFSSASPISEIDMTLMDESNMSQFASISEIANASDTLNIPMTAKISIDTEQSSFNNEIKTFAKSETVTANYSNALNGLEVIKRKTDLEIEEPEPKQVKREYNIPLEAEKSRSKPIWNPIESLIRNESPTNTHIQPQSFVFQTIISNGRPVRILVNPDYANALDQTK